MLQYQEYTASTVNEYEVAETLSSELFRIDLPSCNIYLKLIPTHHKWTPDINATSIIPLLDSKKLITM